MDVQFLGLGEQKRGAPFFSAFLLLCQALHAALHPAGRPFLGVSLLSHGEMVDVVGVVGGVGVGLVDVVGLPCLLSLSFPLLSILQEVQCSNTPKTCLRLGF